MATPKAKSARKPNTAKKAKTKTTSKPKTAASTVRTVEAKTTKTAKTTNKATIASEKGHPVKEFFARKFDASENILTIFKDTKIIGAILAEMIGTGLIAMVVLLLGLYNPLYILFAYIGITMLVFKLSGAHLNPTITVGMMASRRVSAIRGVLYLISQVVGAWFGYLIVNGFYQAGLNSGNITADSMTLPTLTHVSDITVASTDGYSMFWIVAMVETIGAILIAFGYARALNYRRSAFTFASIVGACVFLALLFAVIINSNFFAISSNTTFIMNPAVSLVYGALPTAAEGFDNFMSLLMPMIALYAIFPVLGGVIGFYLSDFTSKLSSQELAS